MNEILVLYAYSKYSERHFWYLFAFHLHYWRHEQSSSFAFKVDTHEGTSPCN